MSLIICQTCTKRVDTDYEDSDGYQCWECLEKEMIIHCCGCNTKIEARLTDGKEIYPHRADLHTLPFWKCDTCGNYVGCHHKTKNRTRPLGCIPTKEIKDARQKIHGLLDPLWKSGRMSRKEVYAKLSEKLGRKYHTANIRSVDEANQVMSLLKEYDQISAGSV